MKENFRPVYYVAFTALAGAVLLLCVSAGSVTVPLCDVVSALKLLFGGARTGASYESIILDVRLPRVLCVALSGAALSLSGAAMQGLLRNPLADGTTVGVSAGASLGAVAAIAFGISIPGSPVGATPLLAMGTAFLSLLFILSLAYRLDSSLSTNTIILIGVIFSMFANSIISLIITFAGERVKSIMFWTMGSFAGAGYRSALMLLIALVLCGGTLLALSRELNAFAVGEDNARNVGVNVRRVKLVTLVAVSALIGVCVSVGGTIGFVGLVIPHMTRMIVGPNHKRLLPSCMFFGAVFLMLADLAGRVLLRPTELPIGVVTSFIGAIVFVGIFWSSRRCR